MSKTPELLQAYMKLVEPCTESPSIYHWWSFLSTVGGLLGRKVWLPFGFDTIYPNLYTILHGPAGGRKSSAIKVAGKLAVLAGFSKYAKEKSSKEQFLVDLSKGFTCSANPSDVTDLEEILSIAEEDLKTSEGIIAADELQDFLGQADFGFMALLTKLWDNPPKYEHPKLTGKDVFVPKPTISLLGGTTPSTFGLIFPPEALGTGFLSRVIMIAGGGKRTSITLPPPPDPELLIEIATVLSAMMKEVYGPMTFTPEAYELVDLLYKSTHPVTDMRLTSYLERRHVQLNKLCIILTAMDLQTTITADTVIFANTLLYHAESKMSAALGEFGRSLTGEISMSVMNCISERPKTLTEIFRACSSDFKSLQECAQVCKKLLLAEKIEDVSPSKSGLYKVKTSKAKEDYPFVDFSILSSISLPEDRKDIASEAKLKADAITIGLNNSKKVI